MTTSNARNFKGSMFYEQQEIFFSKLEKFTNPLRYCAHEMVDCIDKLNWKADELLALKEAYYQLETMPINNFEHGIDAIKTTFLAVPFIADSVNTTAMNNADFVTYFDKQNHFNAEINNLIKKAIEIAT